MPQAIERQPATYTHDEWVAEATRRFGPEVLGWKFLCPACGHSTTVRDWKDAKAPEGAVAWSCVGRWTGAEREAFAKGAGPCNYAGGGLIGLNPVTVTFPDGNQRHVFAFAAAEVRP